MRRRALATALATLLLLSVVLAGCGGAGSSSEGGLEAALGYLPEGAPVVVTVSTDPEGGQWKAAESLADRLPFGELALEGLKEDLREDGLDYEKDLKPMLGNDLVVGFATTDDVQTGTYVVALETRDPDKLRQLYERERFRRVGEVEGADVYEDTEERTFDAIDGDVAVSSPSREALEGALERAQGDGGFQTSALDAAFEDLPDESLFRVYTDIRALLTRPEAEAARRIEWVSALRTLAVSGSVEEREISLDYRVETDPEGLTDEDLPLAAGSEPPQLIADENQAASGIRDPAQLIEFAQRAAQAVDPEGFAEFEVAKRTIGEDLGLDLNRDVLEQLTGDVAVTHMGGSDFAVRAEVRDQQGFQGTLEKLAEGLPRAARRLKERTVRIAKPKAGEDFYTLEVPGRGRAVFGVVGEAFVLAKDARAAAEVAAASPRAVPGLEGAAVSTVDAGALAEELIAKFRRRALDGSQAPDFGGIAGGLLARSLGDLTSSLTADTSGLRGHVRLQIK